MGIFDRFPYSSTHEMNLDFMLGKATEIAEEMQQVTAGMEQVQAGLEAISEKTEQATQAAAQAAQSASSIEGSVAAAEEAAEEAQMHNESAQTWANNAMTYKADCQRSATEAAASATSAAQAATAAAGSEDTVAQYAQAANASAQSAANNNDSAHQYANQASASASNATFHSSNAQTAATNAQTAATNANTSATNASASADRAASLKTDVETLHRMCTAAVDQAATEAVNAANSAEQAAATKTDVETLVESLPEDFTDLNNTVNQLSDEIEAIVDPGDRQTNLKNNLIQFSMAYITSAGVLTGSAAWKVFILFVDEINNFDSIVYSAYFASSGRKQIAFYSSLNPTDDTYIDGIAFLSGDQPSVLTLNIADIPANTKAILFTNLTSGGEPTIYGVKNTNNVETANNDASELLNDTEKAEKAKFDGRFNFICYSDNGASGGMSVNTEEMYTWAARHDFVSVKGDVRISSDGELVMCHDAGFTLDADGHVTAYNPSNSVKIDTLTYAECIALTHPNGQHICGIDALIRTCKMYGKIAYITVRDAHIYQIMPKLFESLDKYNMRDHAIINSFTYITLQLARKYDKDIMLSWVQTANHVITTDDVDNAILLGNAFICGYDYGNGSPTSISNQSDSVLAYAKSKNVRVYESIVTSDSQLNQLYDKGISGAQIEYMPACLVY